MTEVIRPLIKISASSVKTFEQCPKKYSFTYIERMPRKQWEHFDLGNVCHLTLENFHRSYMESAVPKEQLSKLMLTSFTDALADFPKLSSDLRKEAFKLCKDYLSNVVATGMPNVVGVEAPFEFELGEGVIIRGFIDRIDFVDNKYRIVDYKTTKNAKYLDPFQLSIYGLWLKREHPEVVTFDASYVLLRQKSATKDYTLNVRDLERTNKELLAYAKKINNETEWPTSPSPLCNYCDFQGICPSQSW
jgi:CRISPR/Cas system-associated exonuclease Cas4 (RecB family)